MILEACRTAYHDNDGQVALLPRCSPQADQCLCWTTKAVMKSRVAGVR